MSRSESPEDPFPAVAAADDGPSMRSWPGRRRQQSDLRRVSAAADGDWSWRPARPTPWPPASGRPSFRCSRNSTGYDFSALADAEQAEDPGAGPLRMDPPASNCCLVGSVGTGKTHLAISLGLAACRASLRVRYFTAAALVKPWRRSRSSINWTVCWANSTASICSSATNWAISRFSRGGAELLFQVFADRYERKSMLVTSNLPFSEWTDLSRRTDDGGIIGPPDAPLPDFRDERRKLPLPRVDEDQEEPKGGVKRNAASCPERLS